MDKQEKQMYNLLVDFMYDMDLAKEHLEKGRVVIAYHHIIKAQKKYLDKAVKIKGNIK